MSITKYVRTALCILFVACVSLFAQNPYAQENIGKWLSCWYTPQQDMKDETYCEDILVDSAVYVKDSCTLIFSSKLLKNVSFNKKEYSEISGRDFGFAYVNRKGIVIPVHVIDNRPDEFTEGLARCIINDKYGYINTKLDIAIPPQFDMAYPFENGRALVGYTCTIIPVDYEYHTSVCEEWTKIDRTGAVVDSANVKQKR